MSYKVLNLYCGIGGNRKLWKDVEVTAVELNPGIAKIYQDFFPEDTVIVTDAHQYLLDHYKDGWDFIWASPPCPTHSVIRRCGVHSGQVDAVYPDMMLYQEIILLKHFCPKSTKWAIENVRPYYKALIEPSAVLGRHYFWSNFRIKDAVIKDKREQVHCLINANSTIYNTNLSEYKISDKRKILRNMVNPELALYILSTARNSFEEVNEGLFDVNNYEN